MKQKNALIWLTVVWFAILAASFIWNYRTINRNTRQIALSQAQAFFGQILVTREWNSNHGGVFVPITEKTQPNPYLDDPMKVIETTDGLKLTKINPAFMTRQVSEINQHRFEIDFHITSLKPLRPANKPDPWEKTALENFESGNKEVFEKIATDSGGHYRYMAPLMVSKGCMKCHAKQGYKIGDTRGGISITFPSKLYETLVSHQVQQAAMVHLFAFLIGLAALMVIYRISKKYYDSLTRTNVELNLANATKDKLFGIIAHDLRSPFNTILGYSDIMVREHQDLKKEELAEFAGIIHRSAERTFHLLQNLLYWAGMQQGTIALNPEKISLEQLMNELKDDFTHLAHAKKIDAGFSIQPEAVVFADKHMLQLVMRNLFTNAVKFTPREGRITVSVISAETYTTFIVEDTGIGMSRELVDQIFVQGSKTSRQGTEQEKGTGLGLLLCKEFIERNGGKIWVESAEGNGTRFSFTLPSFTSA